MNNRSALRTTIIDRVKKAAAAGQVVDIAKESGALCTEFPDVPPAEIASEVERVAISCGAIILTGNGPRAALAAVQGLRDRKEAN